MVPTLSQGPPSTSEHLQVLPSAPDGTNSLPSGAFWAFFAPDGTFFLPSGAPDHRNRLVIRLRQDREDAQSPFVREKVAEMQNKPCDRIGEAFRIPSRDRKRQKVRKTAHDRTENTPRIPSRNRRNSEAARSPKPDRKWDLLPEDRGRGGPAKKVGISFGNLWSPMTMNGRGPRRKAWEGRRPSGRRVSGGNTHFFRRPAA